ncbi:MAG: TerB family tellurite resistance protein [Rhodothermales bacterium]|nr:TerB family tellurite resistance protein [Rhodothermales bacterium]
MDALPSEQTLHDLALVFVALAYGADHHFGDDELDRVVDTLAQWDDRVDVERAKEAVLEAVALFYDDEGEADDLLLEALRRLYESLTQDAREAALEDALAIAEADGRLLYSEIAFIDTLAEAWHLKRQVESRLAASTASREADWSLLHDVALVYQVVAHSDERRLDADTVAAMVERLREWRPGMTDDEATHMLRRAADYYAGRSEAVRDAAERLLDALPLLYRLALVSDLYTIAQADGKVLPAERTAIEAFKKAWGLGRSTDSGAPPDVSGA